MLSQAWTHRQPVIQLQFTKLFIYTCSMVYGSRNRRLHSKWIAFASVADCPQFFFLLSGRATSSASLQPPKRLSEFNCFALFSVCGRQKMRRVFISRSLHRKMVCVCVCALDLTSEMKNINSQMNEETDSQKCEHIAKNADDALRWTSCGTLIALATQAQARRHTMDEKQMV